MAKPTIGDMAKPTPFSHICTMGLSGIKHFGNGKTSDVGKPTLITNMAERNHTEGTGVAPTG